MTFCRKLSYYLLILIVQQTFCDNHQTFKITTWEPFSGIQEHCIEAENITDAVRKIPHHFAAGAILENAVNDSGWAFQEVHTFEPFEDVVQAYAAGYVEGYTAAPLIYQHWFNTMGDFCKKRAALCANIQNFLDQNQDWLNSMVANHSAHEPYWHHVKLFYKQLEGVTDGYNHRNKDKTKILTAKDFLWLNIQGDLEDLVVAKNQSANSSSDDVSSRFLGSGSCSALIKLLANNSDLYVGHDTWSSYQSMLRVQKKYSFQFHILPDSQQLVPGVAMTFSSYPGVITSGDDFYLISSGIATLETTIGIGNNSLWSLVQPVGQVMETVRSMVANRLAYSGKTWTALFAEYNSGTYNNQWMVVDYKRFKKSTGSVQSGLLWVLEQIPGTIMALDQTDVLRNETYWASYNVPAFPEIFNLSGNWPLVYTYGDWFTHDRNPRALIFRRDHHNVVDTSSMLAMMEYNDYMHDPLSRCNCTPPYSSENAIAARNDVNPVNGSFPFRALGHRSHGSIDTKITTSELFLKLRFISRSGPVFNENIPPFVWSESDFRDNTPHLGHPDVWQFQPVTYHWDWK